MSGEAKQLFHFRLLYLQVLIMDTFTVKIMGSACKMAEITDAGISRKFLGP